MILFLIYNGSIEKTVCLVSFSTTTGCLSYIKNSILAKINWKKRMFLSDEHCSILRGEIIFANQPTLTLQ